MSSSPIDASLMRPGPKLADLVQQMKQNMQKSQAMIEQTNNSTKPVPKTDELNSQGRGDQPGLQAGHPGKQSGRQAPAQDRNLVSQAGAISQGYKQAIQESNQAMKPIAKTEALVSQAGAISQAYKQAIQESSQAMKPIAKTEALVSQAGAISQSYKSAVEQTKNSMRAMPKTEVADTADLGRRRPHPVTGETERSGRRSRRQQGTARRRQSGYARLRR